VPAPCEVERELIPALVEPLARARVAQCGHKVGRRADGLWARNRAAGSIEIGAAVRPELGREPRIHRVPGAGAALRESADAAPPRLSAAPPRGPQFLPPPPRPREPCSREPRRHVGEVVRLAVHRDLEQRALAELLAEATAPAASIMPHSPVRAPPLVGLETH